MSAQLVILAAGVGRRFGGLKQLAPVGPDGEAILDYTVYDALQSGFDQVVLVVRREIEDVMRRHVEAGLGRHVAVEWVFQDEASPTVDAAQVARTKPWGTGHAVLSAAPVLDRRFGVANADDFYGAPAWNTLGSFLNDTSPSAGDWALVGFPVSATLPESGPVSRGVVAAVDGRLRSIEEISEIRRHPEGACWTIGDVEQRIPGDQPVSMNLWGFTPAVLNLLTEQFGRFLESGPTAQAEFMLPTVVGEAVAVGTATVQVLPTRSRWCGVTSAEDLEGVRAMMRQLVADGRYPEALWT